MWRTALAILALLALFGVPQAVAQFDLLLGAPAYVSAYYVSTTGSDSNAGTLAAPYATLSKCQTAMRASSGAVLTCYIRAGTYTPTGTGTSCNGTLTSVLVLTSSDNGEVWSYYPPDGYNTAVINGQASGSTGVGCGIFSTANNVTVNGIKWENYQASGIVISGSGYLIENNIVTNMTNTGITSIGIGTTNAVNTSIIHNAVTLSPCMGIASYPSGSGEADNLLIAYNYVHGYATSYADCGGIYIENDNGEPESGQVIEYNYVAGGDAGGGANAFYIDDLSNGVTMKGNIARPGNTPYPCFFIHGGGSNTATGNICDIGAGGSGDIWAMQSEAHVSGTTSAPTITSSTTLHFSTTPSGILTSDWIADTTTTDAITLGTTVSSQTGTTVVMSADPANTVLLGDVITFTTPATGNTFTASVVVANSAGAAGGGYPCNVAPCGTTTIGPNGYENYGSGTPSIVATGSAGNDSNPQQQIAPNFTCPWEYTLPLSSPVFSSPVSFPALPSNWGMPGFWGPPGFTIPQVTPNPSPGTSC